MQEGAIGNQEDVEKKIARDKKNKNRKVTIITKWRFSFLCLNKLIAQSTCKTLKYCSII